MGEKLSNIYCLVDKTMTMCESFLRKTYLEISETSSCRCIRIAGCARYNRGSFTWVLGKSLVICQCQVEGGISVVATMCRTQRGSLLFLFGSRWFCMFFGKWNILVSFVSQESGVFPHPATTF